jgi:cell division septation protein DedD
VPEIESDVKLPIAGFFVALAVTAIAASAATPPPQKLSKWQQHQLENYKNSAPADEYFGRSKMSYLGMNNTFRDSAISSGDHTTDTNLINKVALAEEALEAWARKYPHDPQLARTYYLATLVDRKIWVKGNQERAWIFFNRLIHDFPDTYFGKVLKRDLAIGYTEHYYAPAQPCATPSPSPTPTSTDASAPTAALPTDTPSPVASPTAEPSPTPSPGPVETTIAKGLRVQIIPQACVPPPTPSPSPSPTPTPTPAATPISEPTASGSAAPAVSAAPTSAPT